MTNEERIVEQMLGEQDRYFSGAELVSENLSRATVFRTIKKMNDDGMLEEAKGKFRLAKNSRAYIEWDVSRPPHEKTKVRFDRSLLEEYEPNKTFFLSESQRQSLVEANEGVENFRDGVEYKTYERVLASLMIDLTHASSNLENVKISWLDTKTLLEFGECPDGLTEMQLKVVLNHKNAIAFLSENRADLNVTKRDVMDVHALLTDGLFGDPSAIGRLRNVVVTFEDSAYLPPDNPHELAEIFEMFCRKASKIQNPYEKAFFTMAMIPYMQPFQDGNKRTSRVAMNIPLVGASVAPFSFNEMKKRDYMFGLLALYEKGTPLFLAETFTASYLKSVKKYGAIVQMVNGGGIINSIITAEPLARKRKMR